MATDELKTIKFQLMLAPSEAEAIDDWGFSNRIRTRAEAIRQLCVIGLAHEEILQEHVAKLRLGLRLSIGAARAATEIMGEPPKGIDFDSPPHKARQDLCQSLSLSLKYQSELAREFLDFGQAQKVRRITEVESDITALLAEAEEVQAAINKAELDFGHGVLRG